MDKHLLDSFSEYVHLLLDAICAVDEESRVLYVSQGAERIFGYTPAEMIGMKMRDLLHPEDQLKTQQSISAVMQDRQLIDFENRYFRKDGQIVHLLWSTSWSEKHQMRLGVARDITRIKQAEEMQTALLAISDAVYRSHGIKQICQQTFRQLNNHLPLATFCIADKQHGNDDWHPLFESVGGCFNGARPMMDQAIKRNQIRLELIENSLLLAIPFTIASEGLGILLLALTDAAYQLTDPHQALLRFTADQIATAIERQQTVDRLEHLALYDALTGLPNRQLFQDRVQSALLRARRESTLFALLYLDLNKFKQANDQYGHAAGDVVLQTVANRIKASVRETDTVVRFGGDEFVILLDAVDSRAAAESVAEKISDVLAEPYQWQHHQIELSASIGLALFPEQGEEIQQLITAADEAMYQAKKRHKTHVY